MPEECLKRTPPQGKGGLGRVFDAREVDYYRIEDSTPAT
jgi:hypothetical protein